LIAMALERADRDPGIALLRLDRPERRNALDTSTLHDLVGALEELASDDELRALILSTTSTQAFCAGADVTEVLTPEGGIERMEAFARLYAAWEGFPAPTICVCVGDVLGAGAELAAGADLRVGADPLKLGWVGTRLGVPVGVARLVPLVGLGRAKELLLTGRVLDAAQAAALGLLHRVAASPAAAEDEALELASEIAAHPAAGTRQAKRLLREFEGTAERVARENEILERWQREGPGLPHRRPE
jgi:enoyl-CoA hydratase/carnithine racemase